MIGCTRTFGHESQQNMTNVGKTLRRSEKYVSTCESESHENHEAQNHTKSAEVDSARTSTNVQYVWKNCGRHNKTRTLIFDHFLADLQPRFPI